MLRCRRSRRAGRSRRDEFRRLRGHRESPNMRRRRRMPVRTGSRARLDQACGRRAQQVRCTVPQTIRSTLSGVRPGCSEGGPGGFGAQRRRRGPRNEATLADSGPAADPLIGGARESRRTRVRHDPGGRRTGPGHRDPIGRLMPLARRCGSVPRIAPSHAVQVNSICYEFRHTPPDPSMHQDTDRHRSEQVPRPARDPRLPRLLRRDIGLVIVFEIIALPMTTLERTHASVDSNLVLRRR